MLQIRTAQMRVLAADAGRRFVASIVADAAVEHGALPDLTARVEAAVWRAETYGIFRREDLLWFVDLDLCRGEAWETLPGLEWALATLDAPTTDVAGRRYRLEKKLSRWDAHEH